MAPFALVNLIILNAFCRYVHSAKPNFVFILLDDQDLLLDTPLYMPYLQSLIVNQGVTMKNAFVSTPVCCPSRTETISGRYYHNIGAPTGNCMHVNAEGHVFNNNSIFNQLYNNGYKTGVFGKLTNGDNGYFCNDPQNPKDAGMHRVYSMCGPKYYQTKYFNYSHDENFSEYTALNATDPNTYQIAQLGNASLNWIESKLTQNQKFFAYIGPHSPHEPFTVAPWFADVYTNNMSIKAPRTPNYNKQAVNQQPWIMNTAELNQTTMDRIDQIYRDRLGSDLQVDLIIHELIELLNKYKALDQTYIIFSSDHGYHLGQNRLPCEKHEVFDTDIHVPFYIIGPNIKAKSSSDLLIGNVDIMPTVLDLAGLDIPDSVDGKSFAPFIDDSIDIAASNQTWREEYLVEYVAVANRYFNICGIWYPDQTNENVGNVVTPSALSNGDLMYVLWGDGNEYNPGNTYRSLRIINKTTDWSYSEYVDFSFDTKAFNNPYLFALYDLNQDPWEMDNIYNSTQDDVKQELHEMLMDYGTCQGSTCP